MNEQDNQAGKGDDDNRSPNYQARRDNYDNICWKKIRDLSSEDCQKCKRICKKGEE